MRIFLYSPSTHGLGHITILLPVIEELHRRRPELWTRIVTPLVSIGAFELPANVDVVALPPVSATRKAMRAEMYRKRGQVLRKVVAAFEPDLMLVDTRPAGREGELLPAIEWLRHNRPHTRWVYSVSDILSSPERSRRELHHPPVAEVLTHLYDRILVHGDPAISRLIQDSDLSEAVARKTEYTGYVLRDAPPASRATVRAQLGAGDRPLVVVTIGSGIDGIGIIRAYAAARRDGLLDGVVSFITTGLSLPLEAQDTLPDELAALPDTTVTAFTPDLASYIQAADVTVCMSGMTGWEAPALGCRTVVVPRGGGDVEQRIRAERLARLGLVTLLLPEELSPASLSAAIRRALAGPPPAARLDIGGLRRSVDAIEQLLVQEDRRVPV